LKVIVKKITARDRFNSEENVYIISKNKELYMVKDGSD
jgi:hypothetical protein